MLQLWIWICNDQPGCSIDVTWWQLSWAHLYMFNAPSRWLFWLLLRAINFNMGADNILPSGGFNLDVYLTNINGYLPLGGAFPWLFPYNEGGHKHLMTDSIALGFKWIKSYHRGSLLYNNDDLLMSLYMLDKHIMLQSLLNETNRLFHSLPTSVTHFWVPMRWSNSLI